MYVPGSGTRRVSCWILLGNATATSSVIPFLRVDVLTRAWASLAYLYGFMDEQVSRKRVASIGGVWADFSRSESTSLELTGVDSKLTG